MQLRRKRTMTRRARDEVRRRTKDIHAPSKTTAGAAAVTGLAGAAVVRRRRRSADHE